MAKQTIGIGTDANDGTGDQVRVAFGKVNDNFNEVYGNDFTTYDRLGAEFTTSDVISASEVSFGSAQVFTKTLTAETSFTYTGAQVGMVKDLIINADGNSFALPTGTKIIAGTPTTGINFIQVVVTASGEYWTSISQEQV
jgi:hypothetical protein